MAVQIAKRITDRMKLHAIAAKLRVPDYEVPGREGQTRDRRVTDAAFDVIKTWRERTTDDREAYRTMVRVLTQLEERRILWQVMGVKS